MGTIRHDLHDYADAALDARMEGLLPVTAPGVSAPSGSICSEQGDTKDALLVVTMVASSETECRESDELLVARLDHLEQKRAIAFECEPGKVLLVDGLNTAMETCTEDELADLFEDYGMVRDVVIMGHPAGPCDRQVALVVMDSQGAARHAETALHANIYKGERLDVKRMDPAGHLKFTSKAIQMNDLATVAIRPFQQSSTRPQFGTIQGGVPDRQKVQAIGGHPAPRQPESGPSGSADTLALIDHCHMGHLHDPHELNDHHDLGDLFEPSALEDLFDLSALDVETASDLGDHWAYMGSQMNVQPAQTEGVDRDMEEARRMSLELGPSPNLVLQSSRKGAAQGQLGAMPAEARIHFGMPQDPAQWFWYWFWRCGWHLYTLWLPVIASQGLQLFMQVAAHAEDLDWDAMLPRDLEKWKWWGKLSAEVSTCPGIPRENSETEGDRDSSWLQSHVEGATQSPEQQWNNSTSGSSKSSSSSSSNASSPSSPSSICSRCSESGTVVRALFV
jgi:hypothetical protein